MGSRLFFLVVFGQLIELVVVHRAQIAEPIQICRADGLIIPAIDYFELSGFRIDEVQFKFVEGAVDGEGFGGVDPEVVGGG